MRGVIYMAAGSSLFSWEPLCLPKFVFPLNWSTVYEKEREGMHTSCQCQWLCLICFCILCVAFSQRWLNKCSATGHVVRLTLVQLNGRETEPLFSQCVSAGCHISDASINIHLYQCCSLQTEPLRCFYSFYSLTRFTLFFSRWDLVALFCVSIVFKVEFALLLHETRHQKM